MIEKITIDYKKDLPKGFHYLKDGRKHLLPKEIKFKPGLNLIIGENGCGKTTLLKLLSKTCLVGGLRKDISLWSQLDFYFPYPDKSKFFSPDFSRVQECVKVVNDFDAPVVRMDKIDDRRDGNGDFTNVEDFVTYMNETSMSKGQKMMNTINTSIHYANELLQNYSIDSIIPKECYNSAFKEAYDAMREYVANNTTELKKQAVFLMDEPDEGLDIKNLTLLKNFLIEAGKGIQIICVLHNPLLVKRLVESTNANVIQLTKGYLKAILDF